MTNEFMRFLISNTELNQMASVKRLITPTKDLSFDKVYAPIGDVAKDLIIFPTALGIEDTLASQIRIASFNVATGAMTIDEAVANYGSIK
jgi:multiple sugar transport system substrate-binding protein